VRRAGWALLAAAVAGACGRKGPPLPPLVTLPAPPVLMAERRGDVVDLRVTVPNANTDGRKPADIERVDVYGFTGPETVTDAQLLKRGTRIDTVPVRPPAPPEEETADQIPPAASAGAGAVQGETVRLEETLTASQLVPVVLDENGPRGRSATATGGPMLGVPPAVPARTYVSVGINMHGRRGALSKRVAVPLVPPPAAPTALSVSYTEQAVNLTWAAPVHEVVSEGGVLPSTPLGPKPPAIAYNVYETGGTPGGPGETRLTSSPVAGQDFSDARIAWGVRRCYAVRTVETLDALSLESVATPPVCVTLTDTFPPAAPTGLTAVPSERAISLIWQANAEKDLAGYVVLRGVPGGDLTPLTPAPIQGTTYRDEVEPGVRYVYAVRAVDKAGNQSPPSSRVEEVAR
jgi:hypothetical protein